MILILDFGSQYTQLIARRVREAKVYCEIHPYNLSVDRIRQMRPEGIIFSGGPASVYAEGAPLPDMQVLETSVPILGICYGMNVLFQLSDGIVMKADRREFGSALLTIDDTSDLFAGFSRGEETRVWMSHGDQMKTLPSGWQILAHSVNSPIAAGRGGSARLYGLQFHPEVVHSERGREILQNFLFRICRCEPNWTMEGFIEREVQLISVNGLALNRWSAASVGESIRRSLRCLFTALLALVSPASSWITAYCAKMKPSK
jgi:GMP synthase (glutamine-hydrolysing)